MIPLPNTEIHRIELALGIAIPVLYRDLLVKFGHGQHQDVEIYHPLEIADLYRHHFERDEDLFGEYMPFGCNNRTQEIWLTRPKENLAAAIWHETHPDDYAEEAWLTYPDWLGRHAHLLSQTG